MMQEVAENMVPRGGFEPPTPAFSVHGAPLKSLQNNGIWTYAKPIFPMRSREQNVKPVQVNQRAPHFLTVKGASDE